MNYQNIVVLGGTGFIGKQIVLKLINLGKNVKVITRQLPTQQLTYASQAEYVKCDVYNEQQLIQCLDGTDAVINLIGILNSDNDAPYGKAFAKTHVALPALIISICKKLSIKRLLHMSALNASLSAPSMYLRSRAEGERLVRQAQLNNQLLTTIYRPSIVYGPNDHLLNTFSKLQTYLPIIPLACAHARFQPIHVNDVAQAFINTLDKPQAIGKIYELGGPTVYTLKEIMSLVGQAKGRSRMIISLPQQVAYYQAMIFEKLPGQLITRDNLKSMSVDSTLSKTLDSELNISPVILDDVIKTCLLH